MKNILIAILLPLTAMTAEVPFMNTTNCYQSALPPVYYPLYCHWVAAIDAYGDSLETEDGAVWKINTYDRNKIFDWRSNDPIVLTQNRSWFSSYLYRMVNSNTGSEIEVNLVAGPFLNSEHARFVAGIDLYSSEVVLTDGTRWSVSYFDRGQLSGWVQNDCIIIGHNTGWDSSCDSVLINTNMNNFVRAKQH